MITEVARYFKYHMPAPLRSIINSLYYDSRICQFQRKQVDYVVMDGCKFLPSEELTSLVRPRGPWFEGIKCHDVVLDIGAGIGSVAMPLASSGAFIHAVEPLFYQELESNVRLNHLLNIKCWQMALGEKGAARVSYGSKSAVVSILSLSDIREAIAEWSGSSTIDFLKVDCEGAEWNIRMCEVEGIRELRIEWHIRRGKAKQDNRKLEAWVKFLEDKGHLVKCYRNMHESDIQFKEIVYMVVSLGRTEPFPEQLFP